MNQLITKRCLRQNYLMRKFYLIILTLAAVYSSVAAQTIVQSNDRHIQYMGRVAHKADAAVLSWPGTSVKINFTGSSVSALLKDERGDNFYDVLIDDSVRAKIKLDTAKQLYTLAKGLSKGKHSVELFKATEWSMGRTWFYHFELDKPSTILAAPATNKRKIEFYGNSITCGYAVEDTTGKDRGTAPYENNYKSYAAITARHFNAEYSCIARSGIGITVSWAPLIMPEMYNRLDATDPASKWDFKKYTPDVVVINLFQNDSWIVKQPQNEQFKARFGTTPPTPEFIVNAYRNFVSSIRSKYPNAQIICALGSMDATRAGSPWPGYIEQAVASLNDKRIYTHFFPYKNTGGHPSEKEQKDMAASLILYISQHIKW
jgi:hypothetical protein